MTKAADEIADYGGSMEPKSDRAASPEMPSSSSADQRHEQVGRQDCLQECNQRVEDRVGLLGHQRVPRAFQHYRLRVRQQLLQRLRMRAAASSGRASRQP